jgi:hypothetical protein
MHRYLQKRALEDPVDHYAAAAAADERGPAAEAQAPASPNPDPFSPKATEPPPSPAAAPAAARRGSLFSPLSSGTRAAPDGRAHAADLSMFLLTLRMRRRVRIDILRAKGADPRVIRRTRGQRSAAIGASWIDRRYRKRASGEMRGAIAESSLTACRRKRGGALIRGIERLQLAPGHAVYHSLICMATWLFSGCPSWINGVRY